MADDSELIKDLLAVLAKHGVKGLPESSALNSSSSVSSSSVASLPSLGVTRTGNLNPGSLVASYIREIITGDQAFDERVLQQVTSVLSRGQR